MTHHDLVIKGSDVVRPGEDGTTTMDIAVSNGVISAVEPELDTTNLSAPLQPE
jgi:dihydroorotase-like cyclic amidohydrolase